MRPIVKAHAKPEICIEYALRDGAEPLGGTLPPLTCRKRARPC